MIFIVYILLIMYSVVYLASRPKKAAPPSKRRIAFFACALSLLMLGQSYYLVRTPPSVDYFGIGWYGFIQYLNARFAANGVPNRIPMPGNPQ